MCPWVGVTKQNVVEEKVHLKLGMQFAKRAKKSGGREFANFNWVICLSSAAKQVNTEAASAVLEVFSRKFNSFPLLCLNLLKY